MRVYLGIDVGSVSTNVAVLDEAGEVLDTLYVRTQGRPIAAIQEALREIRRRGAGGEVAEIGRAHV